MSPFTHALFTAQRSQPRSRSKRFSLAQLFKLNRPTSLGTPG